MSAGTPVRNRADGIRRLIAGALPPPGIMRLLVVVGGGLMVLQSSQGLELPKLAYLAMAGIAFVFSCREILDLRGTAMFAAARSWLVVSLMLLALIAVSLPVAIASGTSLSSWLRDAATYGLFAAAPVFALDAAASMRRGQLLGLTIAIGALGALSFAINWITLRNLADLPFDKFVLPTGSLPGALFLVSLGAAIVDHPHRLAWIVLGGGALGSFIVGGSRSSLVILVALPLVVLYAGRPFVARSIAASVGIGIVAFALVVAIQAGFVGASQEIARPDGSSQTLRPAPNPDVTVISRTLDFVAAPGRDGSLQERLAQYRVAWDLFASSPLLGVGIGHPFVWTRLDGSVKNDFTADTPLVLPAKLGIAGVAWVIVLGLVWLQFVQRLRRTAGVTIPGLAMAGWAGIIVAGAWAAFAIEDKGFSFAIMLVLALAFIEVERARSPNRRSAVLTFRDDRELVTDPAEHEIGRAPAGGRGRKEPGPAQQLEDPSRAVTVVHRIPLGPHDRESSLLKPVRNGARLEARDSVARFLAGQSETEPHGNLRKSGMSRLRDRDPSVRHSSHLQ